jgi:hypothetical protein
MVMLAGCGTIIPDNKNDNQKAMQGKADAVVVAKNKIADNSDKKMSEIATMAQGVDYSLSKVPATNVTHEVTTAKEINQRVISIAGSPKVDELAKIKSMVDLLNSEIAKERERGTKLLQQKDVEILSVQKKSDDLDVNLNKKIGELATTAKKQAEAADDNKVIIDNVNKYFGLGAVFYGIKRFVTSCVVGILIFGVIFLVLRLLAATNPIAAEVFSVFNIIGAVVVNIIKGVAPKSLNFSGFSPSVELEKYKTTLSKLIDNIEEIQTMARDGKSITIDDLLQHFDKELDQSDKDLIKELKTMLRWTK